MGANVIIEAGDVWETFEERQDELNNGSPILLAEYEECGIEIYLEKYQDLPDILVYMDGDLIYEEPEVTEDTCTMGMLEIYDDYLTYNAFWLLSDKRARCFGDEHYEVSFNDERNEIDLIEEREQELCDAVKEMLTTFALNIDEIVSDVDEAYERIKDIISEVLYKDFGVSIYRPMYLEDEYGGDHFFERPYDAMEI